MNRHAERKLPASKKRLIEKIDEIKGYGNGERKCDHDQLHKTNKLQKELEIRINTFQKDREQVETSVVSNSEEEEKYLSEFDELQSITDTKMLKIRQLTSSTMNEIYGRNWRRRKN